MLEESFNGSSSGPIRNSLNPITAYYLAGIEEFNHNNDYY